MISAIAWGVGARVLIYSPGIALTFLVRLGCWLSSHSLFDTFVCVPFFPTSINSIIIVLWFNFALKFPDVSGEWSGWGMMQRRLTWELVAMLWCKHWTYWDHEFGQSYSENAWLAGLGGLGHFACFGTRWVQELLLKMWRFYIVGIWKALRFLPSRARWDWCEKGLEDAVLERPLGPQ